MNKLFKTLSILAVITLFITACGAQAVQAEPAQAESVLVASYQALLGKSLNDKDVADFIASNRCTGDTQFQLCKAVGMALWINSDKMVRTVYLNLNNADGFAAYKGELPFGLASNDTMARVEQKFGQPKEVHALQAGWEPGLPDEGGVADHIHYSAIYKRFGVTLVYNSPLANDLGATIHAILISK